MDSFYQAYQSYERRWVRGEFTSMPSRTIAPWTLGCSMLALNLAAWLIRFGLWLQRRHRSSHLALYSTQE